MIAVLQPDLVLVDDDSAFVNDLATLPENDRAGSCGKIASGQPERPGVCCGLQPWAISCPKSALFGK